VLVHLFQVLSTNDYVSHIKLWEYFVGRMRSDLAVVGLSWPDRWEARLFRYGPTMDVAPDVVAFVRGSV
jgi:hypothetical protein